jgi:hypothetical protein
MKKERLKELAANPNHIIGISRYCNRWCERCPFTSRCLLYSMEKEEAGDDPEANDIENNKFLESISDNFKLAEEMLKEDAARFDIDTDNLPDNPEFDKLLHDRHEAAHNHPLSKQANHYLMSVHEWLKESDNLMKRKKKEISMKPKIDLTDIDKVKDSIEIIQWYFMQINVKLVRAFSSRFMDEAEGWDEEGEPKDSDGSAKVALIGIDHSIEAWSIMLTQFPEEENVMLDMLVQLEKLRKSAENEFPEARSFKRPGFDE